MFTSKLIHILESYDPYGLHRINGIKATYLLFVLSFVNLTFGVYNPYFYFFYAPMTAINAEILGVKLKDKYKFLIFSLSLTALIVFLFDTSRHYPLFFFFIAFSVVITLYCYALKHHKQLLLAVPIILSLAAYSLQYGELNADVFSAFINALNILKALCILVGALILFPLKYYYRAWLRAFFLLTQETLQHFIAISEQKTLKTTVIHGHTLNLFNISQLLPRKLPIYSILKINLLLNRLHLISCTSGSEYSRINRQQLDNIILQLRYLALAIQEETPCQNCSDYSSITKLIKSWNYLCSRI